MNHRESTPDGYLSKNNGVEFQTAHTLHDDSTTDV